MSYFVQNLSEKIDPTIMYATIIAVILHGFIIFGISFTESKSPASVAREVATSLIENKKENKDANFIANGAQEGNGSEKERVRLETSKVSPLTADEVQDTQDIINQQKQVQQRFSKQSYLTTTLSWREADEEDDNKKDSKHSDLQEQQDRVRKEIATLEAQLSQQEQELSTQSNIKTIDTNSTTYGAISEFLENFRLHVERIANQNYPNQALAQDITGDVRLMVVIRNDGSVKAIRLLESSGSAVLDEAAKNSVRQSAPYGKFTKDMKDLVELRIIRTWRYAEGFQQLEY
ncbi:MAG: energy transducer TonB [Moraxellaceae bacterium]|nr:energy transducer TonB [Moraxellaceae bacterium]